MNGILRFIYHIYQIFILLPVVVLDTAIVGSAVMLVCPLCTKQGSIRFSSFMGRLWGKVIVRATLLPVELEGMENIDSKQSYIVVANHQSCYDIFLIIGYFRQSLRWMMKASLMKIPFLGGASRTSGFIPVDSSSPSKIHETCDHALKSITNGVSLVVFPEGRRSYTGELGQFKRGAFMIADRLQLPVLPVTLRGTYEVMPRQRDFKFARRHKLTMQVHQPVFPVSSGHENIEYLKNESYRIIKSSQENTKNT